MLIIIVVKIIKVTNPFHKQSFSLYPVLLGTFPVVALMTGQAVDTLTHSLCEGNATILMNDESDPCSLNACFTERINVAITLSLMVGIFLVRYTYKHIISNMSLLCLSAFISLSVLLIY